MKAPKIKTIDWFDDRFYKIELEDGTIEYFPSTTTKLGITSKPFLSRWRGDIGNREADLRMAEASDRGTRLHNAWSMYCQGGAVIYQPHQRPIYTFQELDDLRVKYADRVAVLPTQDEMYQMTKLEKWFNTVKPSKVVTETIVFSFINKRAGTADNFFAIEEGEYMINGAKPLYLQEGLYVVDLKTGKSIDDDAYMQIADYAYMLTEMAMISIDWAEALITNYGNICGGLILHTSASTKSGIEGLSTHYRTKEQLEQDFQDMQTVAALWDRKNKNLKPDVFDFPSLICRTKQEEPIT